METKRPWKSDEPHDDNRQYTPEDLEVLRAVDEYRRHNRRPFPSLTEILDILHALGYRRVAEATPMPVFHRKSVPPPPETRKRF